MILRILCRLSVVIIMLILWTNTSSGQTVRDFIDGAKVAVDIAKLKKDTDTTTKNTQLVPKDCADNYGEVCFENSLLAAVEIKIYMKEGISDTIHLVIPKTNSECSFQLPPNIYEYTVIHNSTKAVIRKGQIKMEKCLALQLSIH